MYKYVIWDFDGTLFDTYPITTDAFIKALAEKGIEEDWTKLNHLARITLWHLHDYLMKTHGVDMDFISETAAKARETEKTQAKAFEGIPEILKDIVKAGGQNWVFTHRDQSARSLLTAAGIGDCFSDYVFSTDNFPSKPAPDAIYALMERNGASKEDCIMIGDREIDCGSGINAGIDSCLFYAVDYKDTAAKYTADSIEALRNVIFGLTTAKQ